MKASGKKLHQRRIHRLLASVICIAFIGFFFLVWQVHAFDLQKALPKIADKALAAAVQPQVAPVDSTGASALVAASSKPDRWSDGDVVSALSSFYQTIITLMGILLGVIGILAVLTLRFLSKLAAEDMAHEAAKGAVRHYLETRQFGENVKYAIEETGLAYELEDLARKMEAIKRIVEKKGFAGRDDEGVDGIVT